MKARELIRYSAGLLRGRRARTMMICILPLGAELFFRFAEAAAYSLLLYYGGTEPIRLFGGSSPVQLAVAVICTLLRWITAAPLTYAAAERLYSVTSDPPYRLRRTFSQSLLKKRTLRRSISALLWTKVLGLLALAPAVFFGVTAYGVLGGKTGPLEVFLGVNAVFLCMASAYIWLSLKLSFTAVPYLLVRFPGKTAFRTVLYSVGFMSGRKRVMIRLIALYLPRLLTVAGLPSALTGLKTAYSLATDIFIKEDEYLETDRADSGLGKAADAGKISSRKKRSLQTAADKA
ncbi:MAG: hypothetical protein IKH78_07105 [Ruminococcus sp.]|nr:hypothetical protein [Ruminococcus sp.]